MLASGAEYGSDSDSACGVAAPPLAVLGKAASPLPAPTAVAANGVHPAEPSQLNGSAPAAAAELLNRRSAGSERASAGFLRLETSAALSRVANGTTKHAHGAAAAPPALEAGQPGSSHVSASSGMVHGRESAQLGYATANGFSAGQQSDGQQPARTEPLRSTAASEGHFAAPLATVPAALPANCFNGVTAKADSAADVSPPGGASGSLIGTPSVFGIASGLDTAARQHEAAPEEELDAPADAGMHPVSTSSSSGSESSSSSSESESSSSSTSDSSGISRHSSPAAASQQDPANPVVLDTVQSAAIPAAPDVAALPMDSPAPDTGTAGQLTCSEASAEPASPQPAFTSHPAPAPAANPEAQPCKQVASDPQPAPAPLHGQLPLPAPQSASVSACGAASAVDTDCDARGKPARSQLHPPDAAPADAGAASSRARSAHDKIGSKRSRSQSPVQPRIAAQETRQREDRRSQERRVAQRRDRTPERRRHPDRDHRHQRRSRSRSRSQRRRSRSRSRHHERRQSRSADRHRGDRGGSGHRTDTGKHRGEATPHCEGTRERRDADSRSERTDHLRERLRGTDSEQRHCRDDHSQQEGRSKREQRGAKGSRPDADVRTTGLASQRSSDPQHSLDPRSSEGMHKVAQLALHAPSVSPVQTLRWQSLRRTCCRRQQCPTALHQLPASVITTATDCGALLERLQGQRHPRNHSQQRLNSSSGGRQWRGSKFVCWKGRHRRLRRHQRQSAQQQILLLMKSLCGRVPMPLARLPCGSQS